MVSKRKSKKVVSKRKSKSKKVVSKRKSKKTYRGRPDMPQDYYLIINQHIKKYNDDLIFASIAIHERFPLISTKQIEDDIKSIQKELKDLEPVINKINHSIQKQSYAKKNNIKYVPTP